MLLIQRAHLYFSLLGEVVISSTHTEEVEVSDCPEQPLPSPPVQLETITIEAEEVEVSDCPEVIPSLPVQLETITIEAEVGIGISSNVSYENSGFR